MAQESWVPVQAVFTTFCVTLIHMMSHPLSGLQFPCVQHAEEQKEGAEVYVFCLFQAVTRH